MKHLLLIILILAHPLRAQVTDQRNQLIEELKFAPDVTSLNQAIKKAKEAGLPGQLILEARFIFLVNENDIKSLAALAPELEKQLPGFSADNTMIFAVKDDFESIVHYTKALAALEKKDTPLFKKHITEAFWLSPSHASQFAPHIHQLRLQEAMKKVTLNLERSFEDQKKEETKTSLKQIAGDAPAFLIHFWIPGFDPSMMAMPEMKIVSQTLIKNKIPVVSFLLGDTSEIKEEAAAYLAGEGSANPGHWLIDAEKSSLASQLRVTSFPTVVLVDHQGRILFNGDPADKDLWDELARLNPEIKPPTIEPVLPDSGSPGLPDEEKPE